MRRIDLPMPWRSCCRNPSSHTHLAAFAKPRYEVADGPFTSTTSYKGEIATRPTPAQFNIYKINLLQSLLDTRQRAKTASSHWRSVRERFTQIPSSIKWSDTIYTACLLGMEVTGHQLLLLLGLSMCIAKERNNWRASGSRANLSFQGQTGKTSLVVLSSKTAQKNALITTKPPIISLTEILKIYSFLKERTHG